MCTVNVEVSVDCTYRIHINFIFKNNHGKVLFLVLVTFEQIAMANTALHIYSTENDAHPLFSVFVHLTYDPCADT